MPTYPGAHLVIEVVDDNTNQQVQGAVIGYPHISNDYMTIIEKEVTTAGKPLEIADTCINYTKSNCIRLLSIPQGYELAESQQTTYWFEWNRSALLQTEHCIFHLKSKNPEEVTDFSYCRLHITVYVEDEHWNDPHAGHQIVSGASISYPAISDDGKSIVQKVYKMTNASDSFDCNVRKGTNKVSLYAPPEGYVFSALDKPVTFEWDPDNPLTVVECKFYVRNPNKPAILPETTEPTTEQPEPQFLGDVNGDGGIDIMDVIAVNKYLLGSKVFSQAAVKAADVNHDNDVTSADSLLILKYTLRMIPSFPL